jgi:hypothetical protein
MLKFHGEDPHKNCFLVEITDLKMVLTGEITDLKMVLTGAVAANEEGDNGILYISRCNGRRAMATGAQW